MYFLFLSFLWRKPFKTYERCTFSDQLRPLLSIIKINASSLVFLRGESDRDVNHMITGPLACHDIILEDELLDEVIGHQLRAVHDGVPGDVWQTACGGEGLLVNTLPGVVHITHTPPVVKEDLTHPVVKEDLKIIYMVFKGPNSNMNK